MRKTLLASVTLAFLAHGANATYTLTDLDRIEAYIMSNDWAGLNAYLVENPELMLGSSPFALQIRDFVKSYKTASTVGIFTPDLIPSLDTISSLTEQY